MCVKIFERFSIGGSESCEKKVDKLIKNEDPIMFETLLTSKRTISDSFFNNYYAKQALQQGSKSSGNIVIF